MKQLIKNKYIKKYEFNSSKELSFFCQNQAVEKQLFINSALGDYFFTYIGFNALTNEKLFVISFDTDYYIDKLFFMFWEDQIVIDTGKYIYLLDDSLKIIGSYEITTPLIGLYLIGNEKLLLLEEAYLRIINFKGEILSTKLFDQIKNLEIKDNFLYLETDFELTNIELI